ncbi:ribonuclease catalytic domain-containing protein [Almyronema epifaneia]|uniref:Ribonuclease catalytic domain-containing protein n=1 Tax=Almyronema epifaneia S1 TaxID=2991925 RepID=A0ABW6ICH5_9CYAN
MEKGKLIEFKYQGAPRLAVVDRPDGKKNWVVIDEQGQSHSLHPRQVTFQSSQASYAPEDLGQFRAEAEAFIDPSSLEVAWELLSELGEAADPVSLAQLLFSDQQLPLCYAAHRLLSEDKIYFKQKGDRYEPRPASQVEEIQHQLNREAQRLQEWQGFLDRVQQVLAGEPLEWQKSDRPRLEAVERLALFGEEASQRALATETLEALERSATAESAFQLLVDLGLWSVHENLALKRSQIPTQFPEKILAMVEQRLSNPPSDPDIERLELTHLKVYTIDDESTCEIDDGLSLEILANGQHKIWVHIADPTRWLIPGDELELEARRRCTTVYLPTGMVPMFPSELATGPMSLVQGQTCCALSFGICLSEAGEVESYDIHTSLIKPTYRLTYEDVDEILDLGVEAEPEITAIAQWAKVRQAWRQSQGAININMPESSVKVRDDDISVEVLDISLARQLVAEMMILAGEVAARYGEAHNLAMPFRSQPQPELPSEQELLQLPYGWVRDCALRRCMPRSEMGTTPARHATLGLDRYSQVTSPIRRYTDLLAHFQLKAHLRGEPLPFSTMEITELTQGASTAAYEAVLVERQTKRYWSLEYLRRRSDEVWPAMLLRWLREHEGLGLVILEDLGVELPMRFDRPADLGEHLQVRVAYVNPREDVIHLSEVIEASSAGESAASTSSALQL